MTADPKGQDPKSLWKNQDPETDPVTLEHIHALSRRLDRRTRFTPAVLALGLIVCAFLDGIVWLSVNDPIRRAVIILSICGVAGVYAIIYASEFPSRDPAEPIGAFLRRRLQKKLAYRQGGWVIAMLPLLPALTLGAYTVFRTGPSHLLEKSARFLLVGAVLAFVGVRNALRARQTRAELRELDELSNP